MKQSLMVGVASALLGLVVLLRVVPIGGLDITTFLGFGVNEPKISEHAEATLGRDVFVRSGQGHDGKFFFLQALDPLYTSEENASDLLDRPRYRAQRMLYPLLAGLGGFAPVESIPWLMVGFNILALGLGAIGTAKLAEHHGASPWWGLAFSLNLGLIAEFLISGSGILAFAAAVWGALELERDRPVRAGMWLVASVLSREIMLLFVAGVALRYWRQHRRLPTWVVLPPAIAAGLWAAYLRTRIEGRPSAGLSAIGAPFEGLVRAVGQWVTRPFDLFIGLAVIALLTVFGVRYARAPSYLAWGAAGFVVLAVFLTKYVWIASFDITRAVAPVFTAFVIAAFALPEQLKIPGSAEDQSPG